MRLGVVRAEESWRRFLEAGDWEEEEHPRDPEGEGGGQFVAKGEGGGGGDDDEIDIADVFPAGAGKRWETAARQKFGTTDRPRGSRWLLADGALMMMDTHYDVGRIFSDEDRIAKRDAKWHDTLAVFQRATGAIRMVLSSNQLWLQIQGIPTQNQLTAIAAMPADNIVYDVTDRFGKILASDEIGMDAMDELPKIVRRAMNRHRRESFREAAGPGGRRRVRPPKRLRDFAEEADLDEDTLAVAIDRKLDTYTWNGTLLADRAARTRSVVGRALVNEMEKSLMAQESYNDFEERIMRQFGIGEVETETAGPLARALEKQLETEVRISWNDGIMASALGEEDILVVWAAVLDSRTTVGCARNHGIPMGEADSTIPRHQGCRCFPRSLPSPDSADEGRATVAQAILDQMAQEREEWLDEWEGLARESAKKPAAEWRRLMEAE